VARLRLSAEDGAVLVKALELALVAVVIRSVTLR
jgi:hypothetical protein